MYQEVKGEKTVFNASIRLYRTLELSLLKTHLVSELLDKVPCDNSLKEEQIVLLSYFKKMF